MWKKFGRIFVAEGQYGWMQSHVAMPMAHHLSGDIYRVYFGTRNKNNQPHIGFVEFDINNPSEITKVSENYVLGPGEMGFFDENGVYPGRIVEDSRTGRLLMYYMGRSNGVHPLFYMAIGLAVGDDEGQSFHRYSEGPLMCRSQHDPWMVSTPWVLRENDRWRMWYLSGLAWKRDANKVQSFYHIKYAESEDGIEWIRDGHVAINLKTNETNIAAPSVLRSTTKYEMWYSYSSGAGYQIGYAVSEDGYDWIRKDKEVGIALSEEGWDSECMAYPCVFVHKGRRYMLYSGNGNGREGIGIAVEIKC